VYRTLSSSQTACPTQRAVSEREGRGKKDREERWRRGIEKSEKR
jgi:hypothetical protein